MQSLALLKPLVKAWKPSIIDVLPLTVLVNTHAMYAHSDHFTGATAKMKIAKRHALTAVPPEVLRMILQCAGTQWNECLPYASVSHQADGRPVTLQLVQQRDLSTLSRTARWLHVARVPILHEKIDLRVPMHWKALPSFEALAATAAHHLQYCRSMNVLPSQRDRAWGCENNAVIRISHDDSNVEPTFLLARRDPNAATNVNLLFFICSDAPQYVAKIQVSPE